MHSSPSSHWSNNEQEDLILKGTFPLEHFYTISSLRATKEDYFYV